MFHCSLFERRSRPRDQVSKLIEIFEFGEPLSAAERDVYALKIDQSASGAEVLPALPPSSAFTPNTVDDDLLVIKARESIDPLSSLSYSITSPTPILSDNTPPVKVAPPPAIDNVALVEALLSKTVAVVPTDL